MILFSSKMMKENFNCEHHELSNWFDDDVEIDEANWFEMSVANFDDDDFSNWQNIRVETIQKIVFLNWLKNYVEIDEKIKKSIAMNQCDDDEKENEKKKKYKNVFEILLSTTIIIIIIVIIFIIIIIIIIIEKNVDFCEKFDIFVYLLRRILCICFVLKRRRWKKDFRIWIWRELEKEVRVCCLFLCWICSVERHSFRL